MPGDDIASAVFTEVFVERLVRTLAEIPSHRAGGVTGAGFPRVLEARVGGTRRGAEDAIACLLALGLVSDVAGVIGRSRSGDEVRRAMRTDGSAPLARAILRSGVMADQIRLLRQLLGTTSRGYECSRARAQTTAPQLIGLLARMPDVAVSGRVVVGPSTCIELDSVWNEHPPSSRTNWEDVNRRRKAIGDLAEVFSLQLERSAGVGRVQNVLWVSRDDDTLGYDIEVRNGIPRRIEVKGSSGTDVQFFLSANEFRVAHQYASAYEIQFWGEIRLGTEPHEEFERLRAAGYPICVINPAAALALPPWSITPSVYSVVRDRA
jgi:hypothetical protein